jgi:uncharacterized membrane protein (DUF4010 family)
VGRRGPGAAGAAGGGSDWLRIPREGLPRRNGLRLALLARDHPLTDEVANQLLRLGVALLAGLLIGLDRERAEQRKARESYAGVRTFPLIALAGCIPMLLIDETGPWLVIVAFIAVAGVSAMAYWRGSAAGDAGATTEIAGVATFLVGALAGSGRLLIAGAVGLTVSALLAAKPKLEAISRAMTTAEVAAVLEFAVISGVVLPLLPDRGYGPWEVLNPREIWLIVVFVTGLSFAGFIAGRLLGEGRGLLVTGLLGGLVSSTAVTVSMAQRSRESNGSSEPAAAAAIMASGVMTLRVLAFVAVINVGALWRLAPACLGMALAAAFCARLAARADHKQKASSGPMKNPLGLRQAAIFAAVYAVVLLGVRAAKEYFASGALFVTAALASVADVDAVTIAITRTGPGETGWRVPAAAITLAVVMNTLVKLVIATRGSPDFRRWTTRSLGAMALVGAVAGVGVYLAG